MRGFENQTDEELVFRIEEALDLFEILDRPGRSRPGHPLHDQAVRIAIDTLLPAVRTGSSPERIIELSRHLRDRLATLPPHDRDLSAARAAIDLLISRHRRALYSAGPPTVREYSSGSSVVRKVAHFATEFSVWVLPRANRERYELELASELAELPTRERARYAIRLVARSWSLRCSLTGTRLGFPGRQIGLAAGVGSAIGVSLTGWPAAFAGTAAILALMWVIGSADRSRRLVSLIKALRSQSTADRQR
jgi:hypothetical protein